jgi:3-oxoacyl-[acyl-carrier protein] reductase
MKYALVTSSTQGIGKAIGIMLLERGYYVFFNYSNNDNIAYQLEGELSKYKDKFMIIKADLSMFEGINVIYNVIYKKTNYIDCIVLNTGITCYDMFEDIKISDWNNVINTNLSVPFFLIQKLFNIIRNNSRVIFIGALMGLIPHGKSIPYAVSKSGLTMLSKNLVKVFKEKQTTVNTIAVGFVDTAWHDNKSLDHVERIKNKIALNRFGTCDEIALMCKSLIDNQYINGAIINIDGGYDMV